MSRIDDDIKSGSFSKVYLIYGEEAYLRRYYRYRLQKALIPADDTINFNIYSGNDINWDEVMEQASTLPFFAEHRLIVINGSGILKGGRGKASSDSADSDTESTEGDKSEADDAAQKATSGKKGGGAADRLADFLKTMPSETVMVFIEEEADKRKKLFKTIRDEGVMMECVHPDRAALSRWAVRRFDKAKRQIQNGAMNEFLDRVGEDMENVANEMEKLIDYTEGRDVITAEDVKAITTEQIEGQIFKLMDAIAEEDQDRALALYHDLCAVRAQPLFILAMLARQFNFLMQVGGLKDLGYDTQTITRKLSLRDFQVRNYLKQTGFFPQPVARAALRECVRIEEDIKQGRMSDRTGVELLIVMLSKKKKRKH